MFTHSGYGAATNSRRPYYIKSGGRRVLCRIIHRTKVKQKEIFYQKNVSNVFKLLSETKKQEKKKFQTKLKKTIRTRILSGLLVSRWKGNEKIPPEIALSTRLFKTRNEQKF